eukprot:Skav207564  [mRNA]  locus=scaffold3119:6055:9447:+ [translate_table: standard]
MRIIGLSNFDSDEFPTGHDASATSSDHRISHRVYVEEVGFHCRRPLAHHEGGRIVTAVPVDEATTTIRNNILI